MRVKELTWGFAGPDLEALFRELNDRHLVKLGRPTSLRIDTETPEVTADWLDQTLSSWEIQVFVNFADESFASLNRRMLKVELRDQELDPRGYLATIEPLDWTVLSSFSIHEAWLDGSLGRDSYMAASFANDHWPHGWACAFKGKGHDQLVSRRWLEYGPWRVWRGANDVSLVQFHDLDADPATALAQAEPAHERMGISSTGGYLLGAVPLRQQGLYDAANRKLKFIVHGREVTQREMLSACAVRAKGQLSSNQPLTQVAYVFMEEKAARAHLHELWLRELECWAIVDGREVRLDTEYAPKPDPPAWVRESRA